MTWTPLSNAALPLGMPPSYLAALQRAEGQCERWSKALRLNDKPKRCERYVNGGHRLYLTEGCERYPNGGLVCEAHFNEARSEIRKAKQA